MGKMGYFQLGSNNKKEKGFCLRQSGYYNRLIALWIKEQLFYQTDFADHF